VTPTILRYMLTLANEFMPALATSRIMSASEARGVGEGAPVSAKLNLAGTGAPDKLDKFSTGAPPLAPPTGEAVEALAGAGGGRAECERDRRHGWRGARREDGDRAARGRTHASAAQTVERVS
jgi:hypothetical protein